MSAKTVSNSLRYFCMRRNSINVSRITRRSSNLILCFEWFILKKNFPIVFLHSHRKVTFCVILCLLTNYEYCMCGLVKQMTFSRAHYKTIGITLKSKWTIEINKNLTAKYYLNSDSKFDPISDIHQNAWKSKVALKWWFKIINSLNIKLLVF